MRFLAAHEHQARTPTLLCSSRPARAAAASTPLWLPPSSLALAMHARQAGPATGPRAAPGTMPCHPPPSPHLAAAFSPAKPASLLPLQRRRRLSYKLAAVRVDAERPRPQSPGLKAPPAELDLSAYKRHPRPPSIAILSSPKPSCSPSSSLLCFPQEQSHKRRRRSPQPSHLSSIPPTVSTPTPSSTLPKPRPSSSLPEQSSPRAPGTATTAARCGPPSTPSPMPSPEWDPLALLSLPVPSDS